MKKITNYSLYLILSEEYIKEKTVFEVASEAIAGGIDILEMREKRKSREELLKLGKKLKTVCAKNNVTFIVNDDPIIARDTGADGVHLGQEDLENYSLKKTRTILGEDKIIGVSTHSPEQFEKAAGGDCNYIAFGPIFPTETKNYCIGTENIERISRKRDKPVFFIGGINLTNIEGILERGARNIAVIRAITQSRNIKNTTEDLKKRINTYQKGGSHVQAHQ